MTKVRSGFGTVIVGSGHAGTQAVTALKAQDYDGGIAVLTTDKMLPYDRPSLSKTYLSGEHEFDDILLRSIDFWESPGIELFPDATVTGIDPEGQMVTTADGRGFEYDTLIWTGGGSARKLAVPGAELDGVHTLRGWEHAERLRAEMTRAQTAVIIGGGYIGLESAAVLSSRGVSVTVVEVADRLLARVTGPVVADHLLRRHCEAGVEFRLGTGVEEIVNDGARATGVRVSTGETLAADIVLVGVGLLPNIGPLVQAGARTGNGVEVDELGRTSLPSVFAAGDCVSFPIPLYGGPRVRLESVQNAVDQATAVVGTILGDEKPYDPVPWFWSHQYDVRLQTVGLLTGYDELVVRGDPSAGKFSVVYLKDSTVLAVDAVNSVKDFAQAKTVIGCVSDGPREGIADPAIPLKNLFQRPAN